MILDYASTDLYVYLFYELVPAKAVTFRLLTFAPWLLRVAARNLAGLWVMTRQNDSVLYSFFFFSSKMHFTIFSDFFGDFDPP